MGQKSFLVILYPRYTNNRKINLGVSSEEGGYMNLPEVAQDRIVPIAAETFRLFFYRPPAFVRTYYSPQGASFSPYRRSQDRLHAALDLNSFMQTEQPGYPGYRNTY